MTDYAAARRNMVDGQIRIWEVGDPAVVRAFDTVPRERFVPDDMASTAYLDRPIVVGTDPATGETRTLLTPMVQARLLQEASIDPGDRVLDVACGLGLSTALIARIAREVVGVESSESMARDAALRLHAAGATNATTFAGDLADPDVPGLFDVIVVNGSLETRPDRLIARITSGGRLVTIIGAGRSGRATLFLKTPSGMSERTLFDAAAAPLPAFRAQPAFVF